jgi:hypothetical protein
MQRTKPTVLIKMMMMMMMTTTPTTIETTKYMGHIRDTGTILIRMNCLKLGFTWQKEKCEALKNNDHKRIPQQLYTFWKRNELRNDKFPDNHVTY